MAEPRDVLRAKLVRYLRDAVSMETEIAQVLQRQIGLWSDQPEIRDQLARHLAETEDQRERMRRRLEAYGEAPSAVKEAASAVLGQVVGATGALRPDPHARTLRDDYLTEHLEIATYTLLIAAARAYGDEETAYQAEHCLREEVAMADWLYARLPGACYTDLREQGVEVPGQVEQAARTHPSVHVTFDPHPEDTTIAALNIHRSF